MPVAFLGSQLLARQGSGGGVDIPSFRRDFATVKTLDHGIGPDITFTRTGTATYFDSAGVLTTATADVPRFDHDPYTLESKGLLIEEGRTNSIRNSQGTGSTNGTIGSGGAVPTNWFITGNANGITSEIIGTGTENGLAYIDIKVSGTPSASSSVQILFETSTQVVAANGQTWTNSVYAKLSGGATTNATIDTTVSGRTSAGAGVSGQQSSTTFTPTSSDLRAQRRSATFTFSDSTVERVQGRATVAYTNGNPIDLTLRIAAPQLERGAFATSYIPTTNAAVARGADVAVVTPISNFIGSDGGTLFAESSISGATSGSFPRIVQLDEGAGGMNNRFHLFYTGSNLRPTAELYSAGVNTLFVGDAAVTTIGTINRMAASAMTNDGMVALNGSLLGANNDTSVTTSQLNTHMRIGSAIGSSYLNGHIRKVAYYPKRLSNERLRSLTT